MSTPVQSPHRRETADDRIRNRLRLGVAKRGAFPFLVATIFTLAVSAGFLARLTAKNDFDSYGDGLWWALVTLTTVGYGDIVPESAWGRTIGAFVMLLGITFISFVTANVTSLFIASDEGEREERRISGENELRAALTRIEGELAEIKARIDGRS